MSQAPWAGQRAAPSTEVCANSSPDPSSDRTRGEPRSDTEGGGESLLDEGSSGDAGMNK